MSAQRVLIKLGGSSLQDETVLSHLAKLVELYKNNGTTVFIVHGGGPAINAELTKKGITWNFLNGQRITTPEMVDTIEMVLKGHVNGKVVRALNAAQISATGISGSDNFLLKCEPSIPELQRVGRITGVNTAWLESLSSINVVPVIAPLGVDASGAVYNINADWAAAQVAIALKVDALIYLTDQKGIWDENKNIIVHQNSQDLQNLIDQNIVQGGMLAKTQTILAALKSGIGLVRILHAQDAVASFSTPALGTTCSLVTTKDSPHVAI